MQAQLHPISARSRSYVGGSAAEHEHAAHVAELHAFSAELGERQKHTNRDLHWGRKGPVPLEWSYYDTERRYMPRPYGGDQGPAYASGADSVALAEPWNRPLVGATMAEMLSTATDNGIDLRHTFIQYANGSEMMSARRFYEFAYDAMLMQDSGDVNGFFEMALLKPYQATARIGFDRFLAALVRIIENLAVTQGYTTQKVTGIVMECHIAPTVSSGREFWYYAKGERFIGGSTAPGRFRGKDSANMGRPFAGIIQTGFHAPYHAPP